MPEWGMKGLSVDRHLSGGSSKCIEKGTRKGMNGGWNSSRADSWSLSFGGRVGWWAKQRLYGRQWRGVGCVIGHY